MRHKRNGDGGGRDVDEGEGKNLMGRVLEPDSGLGPATQGDREERDRRDEITELIDRPAFNWAREGHGGHTERGWLSEWGSRRPTTVRGRGDPRKTDIGEKAGWG